MVILINDKRKFKAELTEPKTKEASCQNNLTRRDFNEKLKSEIALSEFEHKLLCKSEI